MCILGDIQLIPPLSQNIVSPGLRSQMTTGSGVPSILYCITFASLKNLTVYAVGFILNHETPWWCDWLKVFDIKYTRNQMNEGSDINDDQRNLVFFNFVINSNVIANDRCALQLVRALGREAVISAMMAA